MMLAFIPNADLPPLMCVIEFLNLKANVVRNPWSNFYFKQCHSEPLFFELRDDLILKDMFFLLK